MREDFKFIFGVVAALCLTSRSDAGSTTTVAATGATTAAHAATTTAAAAAAAAVTTSAAATGTNVAADANTATTTAARFDGAELTTVAALTGANPGVTTTAAAAPAGVTTAASNGSHSNINGSVTVATPIECYECSEGVGCNLNNTCIGTACWINYDLTNMKELKRGCKSGADNSTVCSVAQSWANSACQSCCKAALCNDNTAVTTVKDFCVKQSAAARLAAGHPWWRHAVVMVTVAVATRFGCVALL